MFLERILDKMAIVPISCTQRAKLMDAFIHPDIQIRFELLTNIFTLTLNLFMLMYCFLGAPKKLLLTLKPVLPQLIEQIKGKIYFLLLYFLKPHFRAWLVAAACEEKERLHATITIRLSDYVFLLLSTI